MSFAGRAPSLASLCLAPPAPAPDFSAVRPSRRQEPQREHPPASPQGAPQAEPCGSRPPVVPPPAVHPQAERARQHNLEWTREHRLIEPADERIRRFCAALFADLAARCYPEVTAPQLDLAVDWLSLLFFYGGRLAGEDVAEAGCYARLIAGERRLVKVLRGIEAPADDPLSGALADVRRRLLRAAADGSWLDRFAGNVERCLQGVRWERLLRLRGDSPGLVGYRRLRLLTSAMFPCLDLAALFVPELELAALESPYVKRLEMMANNYVGWVGDLFTSRPEGSAGGTFNLVSILAAERRLTFDEARDEAREMCHREMAGFRSLAGQLAALGVATPGIDAYVRAMASLMHGHLDWYAARAG